MLALLAGLAASVCLGAEPGGWKAGVARTNITPIEPLWMGGYAARTKPAEGKAMDLWLKALALEDARGHRALIVTSDLLGFTQPIYRHACAALKEKFGLEPDQIILMASHTHSGPVLRESAMDIYGLDDNQRSLIGKYSTELESRIVDTAGRGPRRSGAGAPGGGAGHRRLRGQSPE